MALPVVVIVGRPNVGKSSLFNCLARQRIAIVEPTAGVTRDRISTLLQHEDRYFELVDTGGIGIQDNADLAKDVQRQIQIALDEADVVLFTVDVREGLLPLDRQVSERLRTLGKPVVLVANKADSIEVDDQVAEFHQLGFEPLVAVSAIHRRGRAELLDAVMTVLPVADTGEEPAAVTMKLAIVGKRNAGKSTFVNTLVSTFTGNTDQRVIVSDIPGTTRDAVDIRFEKDGMAYVAIDTAGVRKKSSVSSDIEFYSIARAEAAIRRADVTLLLIDAMVPISKVDKHLARYVADQAKPCVLVVNKWDLAAGKASTGEYADYLLRELPGVKYAPVAFTTATQGRNVESAIDLARSLFKQASLRVSTSKLNQAVRDAVERHRPPSPRGARLRIYYATQVSTCPPTIVFFVNNPDLVAQQYHRYLENRLRETLSFGEVPLRFHFRARRREKR